MRRVIFLDVPQDDYVLAIRAVIYLEKIIPDQADAILSYQPGDKDFYVKRNKASITVRPCRRET